MTEMQQINRAKTFAEIRQIEARAIAAARAKPEGRRRAARLVTSLAALRRGARVA
jgi:hypothetical protein